MSIYLSPTDTAKRLRAALKDAFPGTKFSVRTDQYAGGASIRVVHTDGPAQADVERVSQDFAGSTFDGMIDLKSPVAHIVDGEGVHYGADFVFVTREVSREATSHAKTGCETFSVWTRSTMTAATPTTR